MSIDETTTETAAPVQFRLVHPLYVTALIAAALATFGWAGLVAAAAILYFWWFFGSIVPESLRSYRWRRTMEHLAILTMIGICLTVLLVPALPQARVSEPRLYCANNLKQIALALHNYHDVHGSFPPAYIADETGKPMHSWRVLILPYLEQGALYEGYRFDEPWDGPNNSKLLVHMPECYACPHHDPWPGTHTPYFAVIGPHAAWQGAEPRHTSDFTDGLRSAIHVLEGPAHQVPWMAPEDLTVEEANRLLTTATAADARHPDEVSFLSTRICGRNAAFADASVHSFGANQNQSMIAPLLAIDDGAWLDPADSRFPAANEVRVNWSNVISLTILMALAAAPIYVFTRRDSGRPSLQVHL
jgi:hypothetical protein